MPVHENSIGTFELFDLVGNIYLPQQQVEIIERPGVNFSGARRTGIRGKQFELVSVEYRGSFEEAFDAYGAYKAASGGDSLSIVQNDVDWGAYLLLEVAILKLFAVVNAAGAPGANCRMECRWKLLGNGG